MKIFVIYIFLICSCLFWAVSKIESTSKSELFLTPYIENGKVNEGRNLSQVILPELGLKLKSYSGYLTIDKTNNANSFFWFFPAKVNLNIYF